MFKIGLRQSRSQSLAAYAASLVAVPATTWVLASIQHFLNRIDGQFPRPFGIGFLIVVAGISLWGGSGPGLFSLLLSGIFTVYFLVEPFRSWQVERSIDAAEVFIELSVGLILVTAIQLWHRSRRHSRYLLEQAQIAQARLQTIMDVAPVGVITCDETGYLSYANKEAERLWGQPLVPGGPETWGRYGLRSADGQKRLPSETGLLRALQKNEEIVRDDVIIRRPDNTEIFAQASSAAILDENNVLLGAMSAIIDVTERRQAELYREQALSLSREIAEREALLNRIGQAQRASDDPDQVQFVAVRELGAAMNADRCCFVFVAAADRVVRITHEWCRETIRPLSVSQIFGQSPLRLTELFLSLDATIAIEDVRTNDWTGEVTTDYYVQQLRSQLIVPLLEDGVLVGVLLVAMADRTRMWSDSEILLVEAVAAQTRTSVKLAQVLQREHNIAERLQDALLPSLPEDFPGLDLDFYYQPALSEATIGGDFFDVFAVRDQCVALVVGDLSGKGLAAASQIAIVRNMLRFALYQNETPARAIQILNEVLVKHNLLQGFVTLFVGIYDSAAGKLTYVSCGHESALLRRENNVVEELEPNGPIIGAFADADFVQEDVFLQANDALLMFTDGLSEAGRSRHDFLGVEGMAKLTKAVPLASRPADYIAGVIHGVSAHNQGIIHDDQCLVAAVVQGRSADSATVPDSEARVRA